MVGDLRSKMRLSIWSWDANPAVDPRINKRSLADCEEQVADGLLRWIDTSDKSKGCFTVRANGARSIWDEPLHDGYLGTGNLIPFTRTQKCIEGLYLAPEKINYPIPACGARSRPMWVKQINACQPA
jgi:hypothetical protein